MSASAWYEHYLFTPMYTPITHRRITILAQVYVPVKSERVKVELREKQFQPISELECGAVVSAAAPTKLSPIPLALLLVGISTFAGRFGPPGCHQPKRLPQRERP